MRLAIVLLALWLPAVAWADDDEGLLETPPLGGIPERMQELDREWGEDVGTKDPTPEAPHNIDPDVAEAQDELKPPDVEEADEEPARDRATAEAPPPPKPSAIPPPRARSTPPPAKPSVGGFAPKPDRRDATAAEE